MISHKAKGDILENIIKDICSNVENTKVTRDVKIKDKNGNSRQIDVLIEGRCNFFDIRIAVEAKNYGKRVGIGIVNSFSTTLEDCIINLGVIVCPLGFTKGAKTAAKAHGIELFQIYHQELQNSSLVIPIRCIIPDVSSFRFEFSGKGLNGIRIPNDESQIRFHLNGKEYTMDQLIMYAWNNNMINMQAGTFEVNFNAIKFTDISMPQTTHYCDLKAYVTVTETYYLKLFPANYIKNIDNGKEKFQLPIDIYTKEVDMLKHGWAAYNTLEEMNKAANIENQPESIKNIFIRPHGYYV